MRWLRWNWLDQGLLPLLLTILRACWLWPWLNLLGQFLAPSSEGKLLDPALLVGLPLLSLTLTCLAPMRQPLSDGAIPTRRSAASDGPSWSARLTIALLGLLAIILALWWQFYRPTFSLWDLRWLNALGLDLIHWPPNELPAPWITSLALIYLWLRGMADAAQPLGHDAVWGAIVAGVLMLVGYLVIVTSFDLVMVPSIGNLVILFFASGMLGLAFSSLKVTVGLDYALGLGQRRTAKATQATRYWLASVLIVVGGLLATGLGLALVIAPAQVARLLALFGTVLGWIWRVISVVLIAISYVLFVISYYIALLLQPLIERLMALLGEIAPMEAQGQPEQEPLPDIAQAATEAIPDVYRWLALALFILAVLVIFALVLRRLSASIEEPVDEVRESILSTDLLQDQLAKLWQKWFGGLVAKLHPYLSLDDESDTRQRIRRAYQSLLTTATELGKPRARGQTPVEYGSTLTAQLDASALNAITARYNHARYAAEPPSMEAAEEAVQAWETIQQRLTAEERPPDN